MNVLVYATEILRRYAPLNDNKKHHTNDCPAFSFSISFGTQA